MLDTGEIKAVVLDTSAQICFLFAPGQYKRLLRELRKSGALFATTPYARREFILVIDGVYSAVTRVAERAALAEHSAEESALFAELLSDIPVFVPGGKKLASVLVARIAKYMNGVSACGIAPTPSAVSKFMNGMFRKSQIAAGALIHRTTEDDLSSCCRWKPPDPLPCPAPPDIGDECALSRLCGPGRDNLLDSVAATLACSYRLDEKKALRQFWNKLKTEAPHSPPKDRWMAAPTSRLVEEITSQPNAFGDLIIFWETPRDCLLLAKDGIFLALAEAHSAKVWYLREVREEGSLPCQLADRNGNIRSGRVLNWTHGRDALISFEEDPKLRVGGHVTLKGVPTVALEHDVYLVRRLSNTADGHQVAVSVKKTHLHISMGEAP